MAEIKTYWYGGYDQLSRGGRSKSYTAKYWYYDQSINEAQRKSEIPYFVATNSTLLQFPVDIRTLDNYLLDLPNLQQMNDFEKLDYKCTYGYKDKVTIWYRGYQVHREEGPAYIDGDIQEWYQEGALHRLTGPALIRPGAAMLQKLWAVDGLILPNFEKLEYLDRDALVQYMIYNPGYENEITSIGLAMDIFDKKTANQILEATNLASL